MFEAFLHEFTIVIKIYLVNPITGWKSVAYFIPFMVYHNLYKS